MWSSLVGSETGMNQESLQPDQKPVKGSTLPILSGDMLIQPAQGVALPAGELRPPRLRGAGTTGAEGLGLGQIGVLHGYTSAPH